MKKFNRKFNKSHKCIVEIKVILNNLLNIVIVVLYKMHIV